jgi:voltage-dependent anion channel protein 2
MGKVGKGLGYYSDIGRKTKDLLTKDYTYDQKFTVSTTTESGLTFTTRGAKHRNAFFGDVTTSFKNKNITTELKVDTQSNIFATVVVDDCAPGAKAVFSFTIPDHHSGKIELQYCHEYGSVTGGIGLTSSPIVEATGCIGSDGFAFGGEMAFDTALGCLTKYNAAVGFTKPDFSASLIV